MRLWLVRHGETEANVAGLYSGHAPTPLTERGIVQAQSLSGLLRNVPFDNVLCSELERARHTTQLILAERDVPVRVMPELNEMFFGDWEMRHHRDLQLEDAENYAAWCADWQHAAPTNGESFQHFAHRVRTFAEKLTHHPQPDHLLIVGHKGGLSLLIALLLKLPAEAMWHFPVAHGTWSELELHADFATLRVLNSQARWQKEEEFRADH